MPFSRWPPLSDAPICGQQIVDRLEMIAAIENGNQLVADHHRFAFAGGHVLRPAHRMKLRLRRSAK